MCDESVDGGEEKVIKLSKSSKPILFEVFTETDDESNALEMLCNVMVDSKAIVKKAIKGAVKQVLGDNGVQVVKKVLGK